MRKSYLYKKIAQKKQLTLEKISFSFGTENSRFGIGFTNRSSGYVETTFLNGKPCMSVDGEYEYFKDSDKPKPVAPLFMEGKFYAIQSKKSGKYLDIPKNSKENGVNVVQFGGKMTPNEQFKFVKQADGSYKITAKHSNKSVTSGEGGFLVQLDKGDDSKQNWTIKDAGNGFVTLILQASGTVADVYDGSVEDGGRIWAYNSNGSDAQLWKLIEVK